MNYKYLMILVLVGLSLFGCERDPMRRARTAYAAGDLENSAAILDGILKQKGDHFEASRLYADIYISRKEFDVAEKKLSELWTKGGFTGKRDRALEERIARQHLQSQFSLLYQEWLKEIDPKRKPDVFERIALKGLEQNPDNPSLTQKLVKFYFAKGDSLVDGNEKIGASKVFSQILELQALPQQLEDARTRSIKIRKDIFRDKAVQHFEKNILPGLREDKRWEPAKRIVRFSPTGPLDRKLNFKNDGDLDVAKQSANLELSRQISSIMKALSFSELRVSKSKLPKYKITDEKYSRGRFAISADVSFEDLLEASFELGQSK